MQGFSLRRAGLFSIFPAVVAALALGGAVGAQGQGAGQGPDPERFIVKFTDAAQGRAAVRAAGGEILLDLPAVSAAAARLPARALQALANNPNI